MFDPNQYKLSNGTLTVHADTLSHAKKPNETESIQICRISNDKDISDESQNDFVQKTIQFSLFIVQIIHFLKKRFPNLNLYWRVNVTYGNVSNSFKVV